MRQELICKRYGMWLSPWGLILLDFHSRKDFLCIQQVSVSHFLRRYLLLTPSVLLHSSASHRERLFLYSGSESPVFSWMSSLAVRVVIEYHRCCRACRLRSFLHFFAIREPLSLLWDFWSVQPCMQKQILLPNRRVRIYAYHNLLKLHLTYLL